MKLILATTLLLATLATPALAGEAIVITIKDHKFEPAEVKVPAGKKVKLLIENKDSTPEEFESHKLNREKIIAGNSKASIFVGPLKAGRYPFFGEFNEATAQGVIIAE